MARPLFVSFFLRKEPGTLRVSARFQCAGMEGFARWACRKSHSHHTSFVRGLLPRVRVCRCSLHHAIRGLPETKSMGGFLAFIRSPVRRPSVAVGRFSAC